MRGNRFGVQNRDANHSGGVIAYRQLQRGGSRFELDILLANQLPSTNRSNDSGQLFRVADGNRQRTIGVKNTFAGVDHWQRFDDAWQLWIVGHVDWRNHFQRVLFTAFGHELESAHPVANRFNLCNRVPASRKHFPLDVNRFAQWISGCKINSVLQTVDQIAAFGIKIDGDASKLNGNCLGLSFLHASVINGDRQLSYAFVDVFGQIERDRQSSFGRRGRVMSINDLLIHASSDADGCPSDRATFGAIGRKICFDRFARAITSFSELQVLFESGNTIRTNLELFHFVGKESIQAFSDQLVRSTWCGRRDHERTVTDTPFGDAFDKCVGHNRAAWIDQLVANWHINVRRQRSPVQRDRTKEHGFARPVHGPVNVHISQTARWF